MLNGTTVATDTATEFDLGPLSWVQGEIDQALARGLESLAAFRATGKDLTSLKHARTHIHQAAGAIQMVGLDAVVAFTDEIERQLARLEELPAARGAGRVRRRSTARAGSSRIFLDELVNGARAGAAQALPRIRGDAARARRQGGGADRSLLSRTSSPRAPSSRARAGDARRERCRRYLVKQRRLYQRGLLAWLRGDDGEAPRRCATPSPASRTRPRSRACARSGGPSARCFDALVERRPRVRASA